MALPDSQWLRLLAKLAVYGAAIFYLGPILLLVLVIPVALVWLISKALPAHFVSGVATQVVSFFLTRRLMGQ